MRVQTNQGKPITQFHPSQIIPDPGLKKPIEDYASEIRSYKKSLFIERAKRSYWAFVRSNISLYCYCFSSTMMSWCVNCMNFSGMVKHVTSIGLEKIHVLSIGLVDIVCLNRRYQKFSSKFSIFLKFWKIPLHTTCFW